MEIVKALESFIEMDINCHELVDHLRYEMMRNEKARSLYGSIALLFTGDMQDDDFLSLALSRVFEHGRCRETEIIKEMFLDLPRYASDTEKQGMYPIYEIYAPVPTFYDGIELLVSGQIVRGNCRADILTRIEELAVSYRYNDRLYAVGPKLSVPLRDIYKMMIREISRTDEKSADELMHKSFRCRRV